LDRRTDDPDDSGGASPTVVTSRQGGDDPAADDGRDTRPVGLMVPSPMMPRIPDNPVSVPSAWDAPAVGSIAHENGKDNAAATDAASGDAAGPSAFDSSAFSFGAPDSAGLDSWTPGPVSWSLSSADDPPAGGALATEPPTVSGADSTMSFGPSLSFEQPSFSMPYTEAPPVSPDPPAVSAAAFTWDTPEPPPTAPSSPARTFLRSAGNAKPPAPERPPTTVVSPPRPAPVQSPAPVPRPESKAASKRSVRQAHLTVARVEPWSVMKFSFVVSLVAFIILFVVVTVLWGSLSALGVFDSLQRVVSNVTSSQASAGVNAAKWFSASRVLGWTALLGSVNIVLITAMSTIGAVVYNLTSRLIGGIEVTLRETE
jgi:hypothetical protein